MPENDNTRGAITSCAAGGGTYTGKTMSPGNLARVLAVLTAVVAAAASATSNQNSNQPPGPREPQGGGPPPAQPMDPSRALGVWRSTFGAVKIEADPSKGGLPAGAVQGVWVYQRQGQEVIGYFAGNLRGNILQFQWQEPNNPPLIGEGFLVFDPQGRQYSGRWWSERRDRVGDWNGWRQQGSQGPYAPPAPPTNDQPDPYGAPYGGQPYGGAGGGFPPPPAPPAPPTQPTYY